MPKIEETTLEPIERMLEKLNVKTVFGEPIQKGELTLIPVVEYLAGFGYGSGYGRGEEETCQCKDEGCHEGEELGSPANGLAKGEVASGGGSGGGGYGRAVPRGYIKITPEGATFEPILNQTRIALALFTMIGWSAFCLSIAVRALARIHR
jgi:uncharacterized spore protein YtfJ